MSGQSQTQTLIERFATHLRSSVQAEDRARAAWHVSDWLGCAVAGRGSPAGQALAKSRGTDAAGIAFFWGGLGNVLEMDDVDKRAILHPGPCIIPAALACAHLDTTVSGGNFGDAIVRGYEATIRLGRAVGPGHYKLWHNTATCGPIGAAAACASFLQLNDLQTAHALALATSQAAGVWQTRHEATSMGKQLHTAHAARAGFEAARLAANGMKGPLSILEGTQGFFAAMCPDGDPTDIFADYGEGWLIHQVSFKPWPACRHAHAAIDAALAIQASGVSSLDIQQVIVRSYPDALTFCDKPNPANVNEAKFSLQHSVSVALLKGDLTLSDFEPAVLEDPNMCELRRRVSVEIGEPYRSTFPSHYGAEIEVITRDGSSIIETVPDALGDPENPITREQLMSKTKALIVMGGVPESSAEQLIFAAEQKCKTSSKDDLACLLEEVLV